MKASFALFIALLFTFELNAQVFGPITTPLNSIRQNSVSNMAALGDTLWIGPALNRNIGNETEWFIPVNADSVTFGRGRVFSLILGQDSIVTGLGFNDNRPDNDGTVATALGYYFSVDGGDEWRFETFPLDPRTQIDNCSTVRAAGCDTTFTYGGVLYDRIRVTVPQQSPPFDIDFNDNVVMSVNWASGLLRSMDFGETWDRMILPPMQEDSLVPSQTYEWTSSFNGEPLNRYDPLGDVNLLGFGLLIDQTGRTWVGTAGGINISNNALTAPVDSVSWRHIDFDGSSNGLIGNWIIAIEQEPGTNRIWMTNWSALPNGQDNFGLVYTEDGGNTFRQFLIGERINDITFKDGYVFAAGDNGLFISPDGGETWRLSPRIQSVNAFIKDDARFFSAEATTNRVWIGTSDGIASTTDFGDTWQITRTDVPLDGGNFYQDDTPVVDAYAYPNPFSPTQHNIVRIKFENETSGNTKVRIFDFSMALVKELTNEFLGVGEFEVVWNGFDERGRKVANGTYFYIIEGPDGTVNGKILLVD